MLRRRLIGCVVLYLLSAGLVEAQSVVNYYWVAFADKTGSEFSIDSPEMFLSAKALERRQKQGITIDETDLPVSVVYLDSLRSLGAVIGNPSRWLNGCTIQADSTLAAAINELEFVTQVQLTKPGLTTRSIKQKWVDEIVRTAIDTALYGSSVDQVGQLNGQFLHNQGYKANGIEIAVLDAGFYKANQFDAFADLMSEGRLLGTRDFVTPCNDVFQEHYHGMSVLSTMAVNREGELVGTAPQASYYLFRTEDTLTEYLIEEDNWVAAAEYADSLGVDLINSSLGYYEFNDTTMNHSYSDMDGVSTRVTKAANMAVEKGMFVCVSAGNEATHSWKYIIAPSDGDLVLAVGAVGKDGTKASFSSVGPAADGDIKPNVVAMGLGTSLVTSDGTIGKLNGTSFSSPVLAGMAACLWQANPDVTALQLKQAIEQSASQYLSPDSLLGYGIPDFQAADQLLKNGAVGVPENIPQETSWRIYPNPVKTCLFLKKTGDSIADFIELRLSNMAGVVVLQKKISSANSLFQANLGGLPRGLYIARVLEGDEQFAFKVVKIDQ